MQVKLQQIPQEVQGKDLDLQVPRRVHLREGQDLVRGPRCEGPDHPQVDHPQEDHQQQEHQEHLQDTHDDLLQGLRCLQQGHPQGQPHLPPLRVLQSGLWGHQQQRNLQENDQLHRLPCSLQGKRHPQVLPLLPRTRRDVSLLIKGDHFRGVLVPEAAGEDFCGRQGHSEHLVHLHRHHEDKVATDQHPLVVKDPIGAEPCD